MGGLFDPKVGLVKTFNPEAGVGQSDAAEVQIATSIDIIDDRGNAIGFIQSFNENHNRPTALVRHLSSADAGRVIEQAPSPDTVTLSVTGFSIYNKQEDGSIVQRLGGGSTQKAMKMLEEQKAGFSLLIVHRYPATNEVVDAIIYQDCWLTSSSTPVSIAQATIAQSANISVSRARRPSNWRSL